MTKTISFVGNKAKSAEHRGRIHVVGYKPPAKPLKKAEPVSDPLSAIDEKLKKQIIKKLERWTELGKLEDADKTKAIESIIEDMHKHIFPTIHAKLVEFCKSFQGSPDDRGAKGSPLADAIWCLEKLPELQKHWTAGTSAGTKGKATVESAGLTGHNQPQPDKAGTKDEGAMQSPLDQYFDAQNIPQALRPKLTATIHRVTAELTGRASSQPDKPDFAEALQAMTLAGRRAALDKHYEARKQNPWTKAKGEKPTPEKFLAWLDAMFPDRQKIGVVLSDLKHLDQRAYEKVMEWSTKSSKVPRDKIDALNLPTKFIKYDPVRDADAPKTRREVYERALRGEDSVKNLQRSYARLRHHATP